MNRLLGFAFVASSTVLAVACVSPDLDPPPGALSPTAAAKAPATLVDAIAAGEPTRVLIVVGGAEDVVAPDAIALAEPAADALARAAGARVIWEGRKAAVTAGLADRGLPVDDEWSELPIIPVTIDSAAALAALLEDEQVVSASPDRTFATTDVESFPLIRQPAAQAAGRIGTGTTVAVLDTGVDYLHPAFGCTAPGVPSTCKVAVARDFATEDGSRDANGHGTNVSGIVVGVAPGARVLGLDVFDGGGASSTTILAAYNWVLANRATYNIAAVNLSLGGGSATAPCGGDALATAFDTGRSAGIVTTVASGNNGTPNAISWPACAPAAVSVGAVYDANVGGLGFGVCSDPVTAADRVACFSNAATFLTLLAPGAMIDAAGYRMAGTSQAAPHVAGAAAVLRAFRPTESATQVVNRLVSSGAAVVDPRTGRTSRRLDLAAALAITSTDGVAPTGTVVINAGATYTTSRTVTLTLAATDAVGVTAMCVDACASFVPYATTLSYILPAGADGTRTVAVRYRDAAGNLSAAATDTIALDTVAPSLSVTGTLAARTLTLRWTGADATSGLASYRVVALAGTTAPAARCTNGTVLASGTATTVSHGPLAAGARWSYRVCATDRAGNTTPGAALLVTVP